MSTLENVLANSEFRTGLGAVPFNGPVAPSFSTLSRKIPAMSSMWIQLIHWSPLATAPPPLPMGAPGTELEDRCHDFERTAPGASTMPVRTTARRTPSDSIERRHILALAANDREKIVAGRARLGELFVPMRAVEADRGTLHVDLGTRRAFLIAVDQLFGAVDAAVADLALDLGIPASVKIPWPARLTTASQPSTSSCQLPGWVGSPGIT